MSKPIQPVTMTTITLQIDQRTKAGKALMDLVTVLSKDTNAVKVIDEPYFNSETERVIADAKKGLGVKRVKNSKELFKALGI